jgi:hypothetical protein
MGTSFTLSEVFPSAYDKGLRQFDSHQAMLRGLLQVGLDKRQSKIGM